MRILVTGASGFIGQITSQELLKDTTHYLILTDVVEPNLPDGTKLSSNANFVKGDLLEVADEIVAKDLDAAILLHGVMSSAAEADFDLGYRANVEMTWALLNKIAKKAPGIRVIYASSEAVYGRPVPKFGVTENHIPAPENSYGHQKVICETLINDYTRRGLIDGLSLRFPTISVRPGKPSPAVTSFLSGIIREPLAGQLCKLPLKERSWKHWVCSPKTLVYNIIVALSVPKDVLPSHRRSVNVPGFAVTIQNMLDALEEVGGKDKLKFVQEEHIEDLQPLLHSWADDFDNSLGLSLGMKQDHSFVQSVRDYVETTGMDIGGTGSGVH
jgi:nucleoside-diphosphate-sugar epimerase